MINQFVTTVKWFATTVRTRTNRCAALLMRSKNTEATPAAAVVPVVPGYDDGLPYDPSSFEMSLSLYAIKVPPKLCNSVRGALKRHVLQMPRTPTVQKPPGKGAPEHVFVLTKYLAVDVDDMSNVPVGNICDELVSKGSRAVITALQGEKPLRDERAQEFVSKLTAAQILTRPVKVTYAQWSTERIMRRLLPPDVGVPMSFETIGCLIHLNLRPEHDPYRRIIGSVLLHKLAPRIRTVVNKTAATGGPFRVFALEVLAGERNTVAEVRENGCQFQLDLARVYWNSRLETEHRRVISSLKEDDVFADAFCGVGPFAIPAAKLGVKVYANDLNPASVEYLNINSKANGVDGELISSCGCARDFLTRLVRNENVPITKVAMNFPAGAPEFLDVFRGLYFGLGERPMPTVHCYCFVKGDLEEARDRVRKALYDGEVDPERTMSDKQLNVRNVRDVAPRKIQVCVTFQLPEEVAYWNGEENLFLARKKQKIMAES